MLSLYKLRNKEILNGVLNVKWGITNKLIPEKQELPVHKSIKTMEIYTHVSKTSLTKTPLDNMMEGA